jgi:ABC-2 type transport system ATP-binding protein
LIQEKGMTALVSTAYMDEAERFHRLSLLSGGKVLASGMPTELRSLVPGSIVSFEVNPQLRAITLLKKSFRQVESLGPLLHVFTDTVDQSEARVQIEAALGDLVPSSVRVDQPELEDVFVALLLRNIEHKDTPGGLPTSAGAPNHDGFAIEAEGLIRDFGSFRAVDRVSFRVKQGEIFGLLGANGAGKTTVIKMLNGILSPTEGAGLVAGADMKTAGGTIKQRIGYMSQAFSLYMDLTVEENIRYVWTRQQRNEQAVSMDRRHGWIVGI